MFHWDEIEVNHKRIIDWKEICGTFLPNEPDIIGVPSNRKFKLRPVDRSKMKHYQISEVPACHSLRHMSSYKGHKNYVQDWSLMNSQPIFLFLTYF